MMNRFDLEKILKFVEDNNITTPGQLRIADVSSYRQLYNRKLLENVFPDYNRIQTDEEKYEEIAEYVKNNDIKGRRELQKKKSGYYNFLYNKGLLDKVFGETNGRKKKKLHDINKVIHLLERWAAEEHTTVQFQANKYGYGAEYRDLLKMNKN